MHTGHENRLGHTLVGGCCNSSVDSSAPTILPPQVRVPSKPSMLLPFIVKFVLYLSCEKNENKQKNMGLAIKLVAESDVRVWSIFLKKYLGRGKATTAMAIAHWTKPPDNRGLSPVIGNLHNEYLLLTS